MPFTPFHLGPGAVFKAIGGRHFSFLVFGGAQVLMDLEPLAGIVRGAPVLHGYSHTVAGALAIGIVAALLGRPISNRVLAGLPGVHAPLTWTAAFAGALAGTFSHIVLDAVMHDDMRPWWPLSEANGLLHVVSVDRLQMGCAVAGGAAALLLAVRALGRRSRPPAWQAHTIASHLPPEEPEDR